MLRVILLCLALEACHSKPPAPGPGPYRPIGSELFANSAFAAWTKGSPRTGGFGHNSISEQRGDIDTADRWIGKWTVTASSHLTASKDPAGMRYDIFPGVVGEAFYVRQYIPDVNWFMGKKIRLTARFTCSPTILQVWWYLHLRWNVNEEDKPGVTILSESGDTASGVHTADVQMPASNPGYKLDTSAGFVPALIISTKGLDPDWCIIHQMSAVQIP